MTGHKTYSIFGAGAAGLYTAWRLLQGTPRTQAGQKKQLAHGDVLELFDWGNYNFTGEDPQLREPGARVCTWHYQDDPDNSYVEVGGMRYRRWATGWSRPSSRAWASARTRFRSTSRIIHSSTCVRRTSISTIFRRIGLHHTTQAGTPPPGRRTTPLAFSRTSLRRRRRARSRANSGTTSSRTVASRWTRPRPRCSRRATACATSRTGI